MNGIFPIVREEDMEKLTPEKVYDIYREVSISKEIYKEISLSPQQLNTLCDQLFKKK